MSSQRQFGALILSLSSLTSLGGVRAFAATDGETPVQTFFTDLCYDVAGNGDQDGTDSGSEYASSCRSDMQDKLDKGIAAKTVVHDLCLHARAYSADLNELLDQSMSQAQIHDLANKHIKDCFNSATKFATQDGITL